MQAVLRDIVDVVVSTSGMGSAMMDQRTVRQAIKRRMKANGVDTLETYAHVFHREAKEQSALLEELVVGETSFFRDAAVFREMERWCGAWFSTNGRPMKILSAPCSSGEEPYSVAAMLSQMGISPSQFSIDALDISARAIERAEAGVYQGFSLRNIQNPAHHPCFEMIGSSWRVKGEYRQAVHFRQGNLMDADVFGGEHYDLICSRNLLIYQSQEARQQIVRNLRNALAEDGRLVIGSADWGRELSDHFMLEEPMHSFALRAKTAAESKSNQSTVRAADRRAPARTGRNEGNLPRLVDRRLVERRVADRGEPQLEPRREELQLEEVTEIYRKAIRAFSQGDREEAERFCRQALYLDGGYMLALELLNKIDRPRASDRLVFALRARLVRHRVESGEDARR